MEERDPSPSDRNHGGPQPPEAETISHVAPTTEIYHEFSPETSEKTFRSGTYIVQVPKDQIYRVPPPENALLAERLGAPSRKSRCCCRRPVCLCIIGIVIVVVVVILGAIGFTTFLLKHDDPTFSVEDLLVKNRSSDDKKHPEYDISLKAGNPNQHVKIVYDQGSDASLSFKQKEIAAGSFPTFDQGPKSSTIVKILLPGANIALPEEISRSINGTNSKTNISLSLSVNVPLKFKIGFLSIKNKKIHISCSLSVDTLAKNTHILTQKCQTTS